MASPPFPQVEDTLQILPVDIPVEDHIIESGSDHPEDHYEDRQVIVILRILAGAFRLPDGDKDTYQDGKGDEQPVEGNVEAKYGNVVPHRGQMDPQVGEVDGCVHSVSFLFCKKKCGLRGRTDANTTVQTRQ